ncbi:MAG: shikimate dehydrogenase [Desulfatirhabdiaceae bacterium]
MMDASTLLYGVFGNPVGHSMSPLLFNQAFLHLGINAVYLAFPVTDIQQGVAAVRTLGIRGVSVTIPHKIGIMAFLDGVDDLAGRIGAVNTLLWEQNRLVGRNSDCSGVMRAIEDHMPIAGKRFAIIGAGGAARAIGFGLKHQNAQVVIVNRSTGRGEQLADDLNAEFLPLSSAGSLDCHMLINATSVGMTPATSAMPVPAGILHSGMIVMDIIYNPLKTELLNQAAKRGCTIIDGLSMFVYQAACQFEWWTGKPAPVDVMKQVVLERLTR